MAALFSELSGDCRLTRSADGYCPIADEMKVSQLSRSASQAAVMLEFSIFDRFFADRGVAVSLQEFSTPAQFERVS
jgi:hypothetical protein